MDDGNKAGGIGVAAGAIGLMVLVAVIVLTVAYTGFYNIAATEEHASLTRWVFDTTFHSSVRRHAAGLDAPASFTPANIESGAREYRSMCEHCHGAPGVEADTWAGGMRPQPPHLTEAAAEWELEEVFWLAKHGARMTGMPAFGPTHDDRTLWNVAAFVKELPAMTPERYAAFGNAHGERQRSEHSH